MLLQREILTSTELAEFDRANFEISSCMATDEWERMLASGLVVMYTARTAENELAAVLVLKTAIVNINLCYLYSVAVAEKFRRRGYVQELFRYAIEDIISYEIINSHCHVTNAASIGFHKSLGFKAVQYVPDFYGDYEDAILWERDR